MILDEIVRDKRKRLLEQKQRIGLDEMKEQALRVPKGDASFYEALSKPGLSIIGEFKKASPSLGVIKNQLKLPERIAQYNQSVDAISCLTEEDHFNGSVEYLKKIRKMTKLPILRKDFIVDEYQIYEARAIEADAILLIAAILNDDEMKHFYDTASKLELDVLVEVHDEEEMERAIKMGAAIIGVNNRNLKDFTIRLETTKILSKMLPAGKVFVSESGINHRKDIEYLRDCRIDGLLIGRALMESENPRALAREWKEGV